MNSTLTSSELFAPLSAHMQLINQTHRNRKWGTEYKTLRHNRRIINIKNLRMTLPKGGRAPVAPVPKSATGHCSATPVQIVIDCWWILMRISKTVCIQGWFLVWSTLRPTPWELVVSSPSLSRDCFQVHVSADLELRCQSGSEFRCNHYHAQLHNILNTYRLLLYISGDFEVWMYPNLRGQIAKTAKCHTYTHAFCLSRLLFNWRNTSWFPSVLLCCLAR